MPADTHTTKPSRRRKFLKFLLVRFPIILLVIIGILYGTLKLIERYPVPLREGFEQHISQVTGANASIGTLEKFSFVPSIHVDIRDVTVHRANNAAQIDIKADKIKLKAPFLSSVLGLNKFEEIEVLNVTAKPGTLLPKSFMIEKMYAVDEVDSNKSDYAMVVEGAYNGKPLSLNAKIDKKGDIYKIKNKVPITVTFDGALLTGVVERNLMSVTITDAVLKIGDVQSAPSDFILVESKDYMQDNPLACLLMKGDVQECKKYLNKIETISK